MSDSLLPTKRGGIRGNRIMTFGGVFVGDITQRGDPPRDDLYESVEVPGSVGDSTS
jgi:hypothetical protein